MAGIKGVKRKQETKDKIRESLKGRKPWNKGLKGDAIWNNGKKWPTEVKENISKGMKEHWKERKLKREQTNNNVT